MSLTGHRLITFTTSSTSLAVGGCVGVMVVAVGVLADTSLVGWTGPGVVASGGAAEPSLIGCATKAEVCATLGYS